MKNQAEKFIEKNRAQFLESLTPLKAYECAEGNEELHDLLDAASVYVQEICGQETWTMSDGSYITRLQDEYWAGADVQDFISAVEACNG